LSGIPQKKKIFLSQILVVYKNINAAGFIQLSDLIDVFRHVLMSQSQVFTGSIW